MISKEEFVREVKKEIDLLKTNNQPYTSKIMKKSYNNVLSLLEVEKISDKIFDKFDPLLPFWPSAVSAAYKVGNFVLQNFSARDAYTPRFCITEPKSEIMIHFFKDSKEKNSRPKSLWRFDKDSPIHQIGRELSNYFQNPSFLGCRLGYRKKGNNVIILKYKRIESCAFFLLRETTPYHLFSSDYEHSCDKLYNEIVFLKSLSDKLNEM